VGPVSREARQAGRAGLWLVAASLACAACQSGSAPRGPDAVAALRCPVSASQVREILDAPVIDVNARIAEQLGPGFSGPGCRFAVAPPPAPSPAAG
jgi:hypothetical protein